MDRVPSTRCGCELCRAQVEADARQQASESLEALESLVAKAAADHGLAAGPAMGENQGNHVHPEFVFPRTQDVVRFHRSA